MSSTDVSCSGPTRPSGLTSSNGKARASSARVARAIFCSQKDTGNVELMVGIAARSPLARRQKPPPAGEYTHPSERRMARVLFAHGHLLRFDRKQYAIGKPYPPLATITAAAYLRSLGHEVALYDPMLDDDAGGFAPALARVRPDVVVIYDDVFNWFTKMCLGRMREAALGMIGSARSAGARVVVSGHDAADAPEVYLGAGADAVAVGEAEITLGEWLAHLETPATVPGLVFRDRGLVRRTGPRALLKELDTLPMAAWDLVDVD